MVFSECTDDILNLNKPVGYVCVRATISRCTGNYRYISVSSDSVS